MITMTFLRN